jgi:YD repeat-containing protein
LLLIQVPARSGCRDCIGAPAGGPSANPFAAYDTLCPADSCRGAGVPRPSVSLSDLSLVVRVVDLELDGPAPAFSVERVWWQDSTADGAYGNRWSLNLEETLIRGDDSSYTLRSGSGRIDRFARAAGSDSYFAVTATLDKLAPAADGNMVVTSPKGVVRTFNSAGRLLSITDNAAAVATFEYDSSGRLSAARSRGRSVRFTYAGSRLASVTDGAGRTVSYTYGGDGRLVAQTGADGSTVAFQYNDAGLITGITRNGATTSVSYNADEAFVSVASAKLPDGSVRAYDTPRSPREIRVTRGDIVTLYTSTALGLVDSFTDAAGNRTSFVYDGGGRPTRITNGEGETIRIDYNSAGNPSALVDGAGNRWTADYTEGRLRNITNPAGYGWVFGYEGGLLSAVAQPAGASGSATRNSSGLIAALNRFGIASTYEYNSSGLIQKYTDPVGNAFTYEYDGAGRVTARTDAAGNTVRAEYGAGVQPAAWLAGSSRASAEPSGIERDAFGRIVKFTDSFGNQVGYTWDASGQLSKITLPGNRSATYEYDRSGRLSKVSDAAGNFALYRYDSAGYVTSLNVSGGPVTVYQYDDARNLKALVSTGPDGAAVAGYRYSFDGVSNRTAISALEPYAKSFRLNEAGFGYNAAGRPVSRTSGQSFRYDNRGNLVAIEGGPSFGFAYDPFGRLQGVSGDASTSYTYDNLGLRLSRTSGGDTRRFVYDLSGPRPRVVLETDGSGNVVAQYVYGLSLLWKVAANGRAYFYHFDGDGNVVALSNPAAGVVNRYRYDPLGRLAANEETVENAFRARGAAGVIDDGNGLLYADGQYVAPDIQVRLNGSVDIRPPVPDLVPNLAPPGNCLLKGIGECALAGAGRLQ